MTFVCDAMLGKLAKYLRVFGLDAPYITEVAMLARYVGQGEPPYFFTRRTLFKGYPKTVLIEADDPREQIKEVGHIIRPHINPEKVMKRCIACNSELLEAERKDVEQRVPEFIYHKYETFRTCPSCRRVYWEGSHTEGMKEIIKEIGCCRG